MPSNNPPMPDAIVEYITYLEDPTSILPTKEIEKVKARLEDSDLSTFDRIDLKLQLNSLSTADDAPLEAAFLKATPKWLASRGADLSFGRQVLKEAGVPDDVLVKMQVTLPKSKNGRVKEEDVVTLIRQQSGTFKKQDLIDASGAGNGTVDKALKSALGAGLIEDQGGNPKTYKRTK